jgi:cell division septum initiation protein DivIVA
MSVFEPHLDAESDGAGQLPALDVQLRGRKGQQVAAYIQELAGRLDQQSARAERAERAAVHLRRELEALRNQPPPSFEHLGSEAARVLEEAGRSAKVLVEEAKHRGREIIQKAEDAGQRVRTRADHDAETRLEAARQAAEQMVAKANAERSAVDAETKRLRHYRDSLLSHLGRVQTDLAGFLADVGDAPPLPPTAQGPSPAAAVPAPRGPAPAAPAVPPVPRPLATPAPPSPAGQLLPPERSPGEQDGSEAEEARDGKAEPSTEARPDKDPGPKRPAESAIASARAPK